MTFQFLLIFVAALILGIKSQHGVSNIDIVTRLGDKLELSCGFSAGGRGKISWRVNNELVAVGTLLFSRNPRISIVKHGTIAIYPIKHEDIATYVCSSEDASNEQRFIVRLGDSDYYPGRHPAPGPPSPPPTEPAPPRSQNLYSQDCHSLEGVFTRRLDQVSHRVDELHERFHTFESQIGRVEHYLKILQQTIQYPPAVPSVKTYTTPAPAHTYPPPRRTHPPPSRTHPPPPADYTHTPQAVRRDIHGRMAYEYSWVIRNFNDDQRRASMDGKHMIRTNFLTNIPGYNMTIRLFPNRDGLGYIALYAGFAPGNYDHLMPWPFRHHFEMSLVSHSRDVRENPAVIQPFVSNCDSRTFSRPEHTSVYCGYSKFVSVDEFNQHSSAYLRNGKLHIRIRVFE